jgi:hypothetical protein
LSDEYTARYAHLSHEQLYRMLKAGDPGAVDTAAAGWTVLQERADALATALGNDLRGLSANWSSSSGQEYQRRVGLIGQFSGLLSEGFDIMQGQLTSVAGDLRRALAKAEDPAHVDTGHTLTDAAKGAGIGAFAGPPGMLLGGVIGAVHGHNADEEEKEKARQRMVQVVADLATSYAVVGTSRWVEEPVEPPVELPGSGSGTSASSGYGRLGGGTQASGVHSVGTGGAAGQQRAAAPSGTSSVPVLSGDGATAGGVTAGDPSGVSGTGLAAAGLGLLGAGMVDAAALDMALARTIGPGGGMPGTTGGVSGAANVTEGVIGGDSPAAGPGGKAATGIGRGPAADAHAAVTGGRGQEDEPDEHLTWLTEDDMVWGGDETVPPSVLGGTEPEADGEPAGND